MTRTTLPTLVLLTGLLIPIAQAATVTVTDPNSDFSVTYNDDEAGAFGQLFLSNNTIFFIPDNFLVSSNNGDGFQMISETLNLQLNATTPGFTFDSFVLNEEGDYIVNGDGTQVSASGEMRVRAGDDPATTFLSSFDFLANGDQGTATQQWNGTTVIDGSTQSTNGLSTWMGTESTVFLTLQNVLTASSDSAGDGAFIQKKFEGVSISVNPVPIPGAVWLFASALAGLFGYRRRNH